MMHIKKFLLLVFIALFSNLHDGVGMNKSKHCFCVLCSTPLTDFSASTLELFNISPLMLEMDYKQDRLPTQETMEEKLKLALINKNLQEVQKCLKDGANANYVDSFGIPILHSAIRTMDPAFLLPFLNKNINVNVKDTSKKTALHDLLWLGFHFIDTSKKIDNVIKIINLLVAHGIDVSATTENGETALDYARKYLCNQHIINLLEELSNQKEENDEKCCSICLDPIQEQDVTLPCKHVFHQTCINPWLAQNPTCPNCRRQILP